MTGNAIANSRPAAAIAVCSHFFVASVVVAAVFQATDLFSFHAAVWRLLTGLAAIFATLRICILAPTWVPISVRKPVALLQSAIGLTMLWGTFFYYLSEESPIVDAVALSGTSQSIATSIDHSESRKSASRFPASVPKGGGLLVPAILCTFVALVKLDRRIHRSYPRLIPSIVFLFACGAAIVVFSAHPPQFHRSHSDASQASLEVENAAEARADSTDLSDSTSNESTRDSSILPLLRLLALQAISCGWWFCPLFLSVPYVQIAICEGTNASDVLRVTILSTVVALIGFAITLAVGATTGTPSLLIPAGLVLAICTVALDVIAPVTTDRRLVWIATHIVAIVQFATVAVVLMFIGDFEQAMESGALLTPAFLAAATAIHLALGLFTPNKLTLLYRMNDLVFAVSTLGGALLYLYDPRWFVGLFPYLLWAVVLSRLSPFFRPAYLRYPPIRWLSYPTAVAQHLFGILRRSQQVTPQALLRPANASSHEFQSAPAPDMRELPTELTAGFSASPIFFLFAIVWLALTATGVVTLCKRIDVPLNANLHIIWWGVSLVLGPAALLLVGTRLVRDCGRTLVLTCDDIQLRSGVTVLKSVALTDVERYFIDPRRRAIRLTLLSGKTARFGCIRSEEFWSFAAELQVRTLEHRVRRAWHALQRDKSIAFGRFVVSWEGISDGQKLTPWTDVRNIDLKPLSVRLEGFSTQEALTSTPLSLVPNVLTLIALHCYVRAICRLVANSLTSERVAELRVSELLADGKSLQSCLGESFDAGRLASAILQDELACAQVQDAKDVIEFFCFLRGNDERLVGRIESLRSNGARTRAAQLACERVLLQVGQSPVRTVITPMSDAGSIDATS